MSQPFFVASNVSKSFVGVQALDNVDLEIQKGEIHCLIGENGSGKSTLIKIIGGVHKPDSGTVMLDGQSLDNIQAIDAIRQGVQIIYQDLSVFPNLTVAENIAINQMLENGQQRISWAEIKRIAQHALDELGEAIDLDAKVGDLPMAKKQIVAISRAVTQNAKLIIMDEATSSITKEEVQHLFSIILKLKQKGVATLFVSHKFGEVFEISENVTVFRDGKNAGTYPIEELNNERLSQIMTGEEVAFEPYTYDEKMREEVPLLSVSGLTKQNQFSDISFDLQRGEILGIIGLLGSGRTEVAQSLFGLNPADSGEIRLRGKKVDIQTPMQGIENGIALLPEDRAGEGLFLEQPISDNIIITILRSLLGPLNLFDAKKRQQVGDHWIDRLKIKTPTGAAPVNSLSGGNQQRVVLAKWLATEPDIFILDGPTIGIDIGSKHTIHDVIRDLAAKGMGIIMISDEVQEILDNCNRVLLMYNGKIIKQIDDATSVTSEELFDIISDHEASGVQKWN